MLSVDRSKKKKGRSLSWSHTFTRMYKRTSYHVYHNCVTVLCNTISNINETKRAYCSSLHMYMYIYILYRHWKYTRVCSCQQQFCNKDETSLACASIFCTRIIAELFARISSDVSIFYWREKKRERDKKRMLQWRMLNDEKI